ncbi:MAG: RHS repeat-associated core domain-containing protein, partial [Minicystis sp.]
RLREVVLPEGERVRFTYDAFGRRVRKEVLAAPVGLVPTSRKTVTFLWDGDVLCEEQDSGKEEQVRKRVHVHEPGTFVPMVQAEQGEVFGVVNDHLGMPKELVDISGRVVWRATHCTWGDLNGIRREDGSSDIESPFRLLGQYEDDEIGFSYTRFRYFESMTGRWLSSDPIGMLGGNNLFAFNGCPSIVTDPWGLECVKDKYQWTQESAEHALNRHSPHRPPGDDGKGTEFPKAWSEAEFLAAVQNRANDPNLVSAPAPPSRGGVGSTAIESITINGVTRKVLIVLEVPDPKIPGTGPGVITTAFPPHKNR